MRLYLLFLSFLLLVGCAPQAALFHVEVKDEIGAHLDIAEKQVAVFAVASSNRNDSIRASGVALALANKFEQDRGLGNPLPVFSLLEQDSPQFGGSSYDREYFRFLMFKSGADIQIFVHSLEFENFSVCAEDGYTVSLPFSASMHVYDAMADSLLVNAAVRDTVFLRVFAQREPENYALLVARQLPYISNAIGESMGALLSRQWRLKEGVLVDYPGVAEWTKGVAMAQEFRWKDAVGIWLQYVGNKNARIAAYASYNIAVACQMMEQYQLAKEWANFSIGQFPFDENKKLAEELELK